METQKWREEILNPYQTMSEGSPTLNILLSTISEHLKQTGKIKNKIYVNVPQTDPHKKYI